MSETSPGAGSMFSESGLNERTVQPSHLWFSNGKRLPIIYTYDANFEEDFIFQKVIKFWADNTCLVFKREQQSRCSSKQSTPAISLNSNGYYTEHVGIDKSKSCTMTSLGAGYWDIVHKLLMSVLGMLSYTYRNDSAKYISMNEENLKAFLKADHRQLRAVLATYHRCHGKMQFLPTPFDYLSKQMPFATERGNLVEARPVYVTRDPQYQYLLDHHAAASLEPTFYDVMVINTLYQCPAEWAAACPGTVPSCKNHGYMLKTCRCRCPPGFTGDTCQTRSGRMFPLQPASFEVTVSTDKTYDFSSLNIQTVDIPEADRNFRFYVFIIIHIAPKKSTHLPSVSLVLPFRAVGEKLGPLTTKLMRYLGNADCLGGIRLLWGSASRLACDCLSSLVNNEPALEARVFRGRRPEMGMTLINNLGSTFYRATGLTELTSQFRLRAEFRAPAKFSVAKKPGSKPVPVVGTGGDGAGSGGEGIPRGGNTSDADTLVGSPSAAAMISAGPVGSLVGALGPLLMLLCLMLLLCKRRRHLPKQRQHEDIEEQQSGEDSDSESESEEDTDD